VRAGLVIRHYPLSVLEQDETNGLFRDSRINAIISSTGEILEQDFYTDWRLKHCGRTGIIKEIKFIGSVFEVETEFEDPREQYEVVLTDDYVVPHSSLVIIYQPLHDYEYGYCSNKGTIGILRDFSGLFMVSKFNFEEVKSMKPLWNFLEDRGRELDAFLETLKVSMKNKLMSPGLNPIRFLERPEVVLEQVDAETSSTVAITGRPRLQLSVPYFPWLNSSFLVTRRLIPIVRSWLGPCPYDETRSRFINWIYRDVALSRPCNRGRFQHIEDWRLDDWLFWNQQHKEISSIISNPEDTLQIILRSIYLHTVEEQKKIYLHTVEEQKKNLRLWYNQ
jgi:hypothetical protein